MQISEDLLKELSKLEKTNRTVLSVYLDMTLGWKRIEDFINKKAKNIKPHLNEIEGEHFVDMIYNLESYLNLKERKGYNGPGLAYFADIGSDYKKGVELYTAPEMIFSLDNEALIFPLARELDEFEPVGVVMIDASGARVVLVAGAVEEEVDTMKANIHHLSKVGGWSQMRYQRRRAKEVKHFAKEVARDAEEIFKEENINRILLAGRERMMTALKEELSDAMLDKCIGEVLWDLEESGDEFIKKVKPVLEQAEREQEENILGRFTGEFRRDGLAVAGREDVKRALEYGAVDILLIDSEFDKESSEEFTHLAETTGAYMEFIPEGSKVLKNNENVGAILRFKIK
jgi:peptide chain release factor subunit 1